ncbi:hypothetical protein ACSLO8_31200, partial [Escherichia coli]
MVIKMVGLGRETYVVSFFSFIPLMFSLLILSIVSIEKNRSSRVKVFSTHINLSHPAASWLATQTCANNIFNLFQNNN